MRLLITAAPCDEHEHVCSCNYTCLFIHFCETADGKLGWLCYIYENQKKKENESLSALMVCFVSALFGWTKLGQIC